MHADQRLKILILGMNHAPEMVGIAVYTTGLAHALVRRGHNVRVIAGKPYYPSWVVPSSYRAGWSVRTVEAGVDVTRVAHYVPALPSGMYRILHHVTFAVSSLGPAIMRARQQKPDIVLAVAPSLIAAPVARLLAAITGARCWLHIQDLEVDAAVATGLIDGNGFAGRAARGFERAVLRMFDRVSTISPAMRRKLVDKGLPPENVVEFRNWADIENIRPLAGASPFRAEWGITTPYVALYSGNIANKQGIEIVVAAARLLKDRADLTFVVCGDGPNRASLEALAAQLPNIRFHSLQPKDRLSDLLGLASVHLLPQLAGAADLVLPSKLANMLASGLPVVVTAHPETGLASEVEGCGLVVPPGDEIAFAAAIAQLLDDTAVRSKLGVAARARAEQRWERDAIVDGFEAQLRHLVERSGRPGAATAGVAPDDDLTTGVP